MFVEWATLRHERARPTGVASHRKPVWNSIYSLFYRVSEDPEGLYPNPSPHSPPPMPLPVPQKATTTDASGLASIHIAPVPKKMFL